MSKSNCLFSFNFQRYFESSVPFGVLFVIERPIVVSVSPFKGGRCHADVLYRFILFVFVVVTVALYTISLVLHFP
jgi:hypothetical protein